MPKKHIKGFDESGESKPLTKKETLDVLMKVWERIPLGTRMHSGGIEREIPLQIRELLDKFGYELIKK